MFDWNSITSLRQKIDKYLKITYVNKFLSTKVKKNWTQGSLKIILRTCIYIIITKRAAGIFVHTPSQRKNLFTIWNEYRCQIYAITWVIFFFLLPVLYLIWVYSPVYREQNLFVSRIRFIRKPGIDILDGGKLISDNKLRRDHCWGRGGGHSATTYDHCWVGAVNYYIGSLLGCWMGIGGWLVSQLLDTVE